tara:strand:- start:164 stop:1435 length:1272 start_codon:yes stop_codon:yes gene_type:complete
MTNVFLYSLYFTIGFTLAFPSVAIQFTIMDILSPVGAGIAYGAIAAPWCLKPIYGFMSDKYPMFNWGKRKPYISFACLMCSYLYINVYDFKDNFVVFIFYLTLISMYICIIDVCADSITVGYAKREQKSGVIQSNTWISRGTGTLVGFIFGGLMYNKTSAQDVLNVTCYIPLINAFTVWNVMEYTEKKTKIPSFYDLKNNFIKQKEFIIVLFLFHVAPNYRVFYEYYLREELNYTADNFTYLNVISSVSFVVGLISFKYYFRKFKLKKVLIIAVLSSTTLRLSQIGVVLNWFPYFEIVMIDGMVEAFCGQLIMMPLVVIAAKVCDDGLEGAFFSFVMSVMNFGGFLGDEFGAFIAHLLGVTKTQFSNLYILMLIGILMDLIIPFILLKRMSFYFETYQEDENEVVHHSLEPLDPLDEEEASHL